MLNPSLQEINVNFSVTEISIDFPEIQSCSFS